MHSEPSKYCKEKGHDCNCNDKKDKKIEKESFKNRKTSSTKNNSQNSMFNLFDNFHLMGGAISQNICNSDDTTWYCEISRMYSGIIMIIGLIFIFMLFIYIINIIIIPLLGFGKRVSNKNLKKRK